jgi:hypothetical protein
MFWVFLLLVWLFFYYPDAKYAFLTWRESKHHSCDLEHVLYVDDIDWKK